MSAQGLSYLGGGKACDALGPKASEIVTTVDDTVDGQNPA